MRSCPKDRGGIAFDELLGIATNSGSDLPLILFSNNARLAGDSFDSLSEMSFFLTMCFSGIQTRLQVLC